MKIFSAGFSTETNTFCPSLTTKKNFEDEYFRYKGNHDSPPHAWALPLVIFSERCKKNGWEYFESLTAAAQPLGPILKKDYEEIRDYILDDLKKFKPDMVLLNLHGAMIAESYNDCEGDLLSRARLIVGENVPIGVLLDPHAHLTEKMLNQATIIVCYKEYPHIDVEESAHHLFSIMENMINNKVSPTMSVFDCRMISSYPTTIEPMKTLIKHLRKIENEKNILSISIVHGFPWGDVPDIGTKIIVITNNNLTIAKEISQNIGLKLIELRGKTMPPFFSIDEALKIAMRSKSGPVVLADFADNTGGGAPGDSTFILEKILNKKINNVAIGIIYDPEAVKLASSVGVGNKLKLNIGGKASDYSGMPINLDVEVIAIDNDLTINFAKSTAHYGKTVAIRSNGIDIILSSLRLQVYSTECFIKMGIDLAKKQIIVVKSSAHFRSSFEKISKNILIVNTPGSLSTDFSSIPYRNIKRPIWPLDNISSEDLLNFNRESFQLQCKK